MLVKVLNQNFYSQTLICPTIVPNNGMYNNGVVTNGSPGTVIKPDPHSPDSCEQVSTASSPINHIFRESSANSAIKEANAFISNLTNLQMTDKHIQGCNKNPSTLSLPESTCPVIMPLNFKRKSKILKIKKISQNPVYKINLAKQFSTRTGVVQTDEKTVSKSETLNKTVISLLKKFTLEDKANGISQVYSLISINFFCRSEGF